MPNLDDLIRAASAAYTAMKLAATQYDEALAAMLAHPQAKPGASSADGQITIIDNFAADNRVFRSLPFRRYEVAQAKPRKA